MMLVMSFDNYQIVLIYHSSDLNFYTYLFLNMKKKTYLLAIFMAIASLGLRAQTPVAVGAGSYASFPPDAKLNSEMKSFIYTKPIFVAEAKKKQAIPTNDWWTDLIVRSDTAGALWASPLVIDPEHHGLKIQFPNKLITNGARFDMEYGGSMLISADGYKPDKAIAKDWSDWGVVMSMPDSTHGKNLEVTMAHGVPFTWIETTGVSPELSFDHAVSFVNTAGLPAQFPLKESFIAQTDGRLFGIHLDAHSTAEVQGQQFVVLDLGTVQNISHMKLSWEAAYAKAYTVQVSTDSVTWKTAFSESNSDGGLDDFQLAASARYVKLFFGEKATGFGYSLFEWQIFNGETLISQHKPVFATSTQGSWLIKGINDGDFNSRWGSDPEIKERLIINTGAGYGYFVISALPSASDLPEYDTYAFNKITDTKVDYDYNSIAGKVSVKWTVTTKNLQGQADGITLQGFWPHLYANAANNVPFTNHNYVSNHGVIKTAPGNTFAFTYDFKGILPHYTAPFSDKADKNPYKASVMFDMVSKFSKKNDVGGDTYWDGKNLVNLAKYTLIAKEINHQAYDIIKARTRARLVDWLTYTPGENNRFYAHYDRWGAFIGFDPSYGSEQFTDNHFHYGYLVQACSLYGMVDPEFLTQYKDMIRLIAKQYANWDRKDTSLPYFRTLDPMIGHSYAGGVSSATGNNQESSSESMQSWIGMFQLADMIGDQEMRKAAAFGYTTESYATLEYWFDWKKRNFPSDFQYHMASIIFNGGSVHATYFGGQAIYTHGIQYLPITPGFRYLATDTTWAKQEYSDLLKEAAAEQGQKNEGFYGADWANVALGFKQLSDPQYVAAFIDENMKLPFTDSTYVMKDVTAGITYYYTHAGQNLGRFSSKYHTDFPLSSVFEKGGKFAHAVAYNSAASDKLCNIYDEAGQVLASFNVPGHTLITYPSLPLSGQQPENCYGVTAVKASASSGNAQAAVDGDPGTRWESKFDDDQYLTVDLGIPTRVNKITIAWEDASAKAYNILGSSDELTWDTVAVKMNMPPGTSPGRVDHIDSIGKVYRYLKMEGKERNTGFGYSIYEFEICGSTVTANEGDSSAVIVLPALIQAEKYHQMKDVRVESTLDAAGGKNIGMNSAGGWIDYQVNVPSASTYQFKLRLASNTNNGRIEILSDRRSVFSLAVPNTKDLQKWTTVNAAVDLPRGRQSLRVKAIAAPFNLNWIDVQPATYGFSAHIEAEDYVQMSGVQTEQTNDVGGGLNVGYMDGGDWMDYTVNIPTAGDYIIKYRLSSPYNNTRLQLKAENAVKATVRIPQTKDYQDFSTVSNVVHFAGSGQQTIRLYALTNGFNVNWLEIEKSASGLVSKDAATSNAQPNHPDSLQLDAVNILTPNGDGKNDVWVVRNIDQYPNNMLKIFDQSGKLLYTKKEYNNDWDGNYNGAVLPEGTYYYVFTYGNAARQMKGFITIIWQK
jgi:gliding motility-associated-like protein